jgi:transcription elongation factor Elf1
MDIQMTKETLRPLSRESYMLARKARREIRLTGKTTVVCPKCGTSPTITTTPKGERTTVSCKCGLIYDGEINF